MPGFVKVGYTDKLTEDRVRRIYSTGVPLPFDVAYRRITSSPRLVEHRAHELLSRHRTNPRREFFAVEVPQAVAAIEQACLDAAGIGSRADELVTLLPGDAVALTLRESQLLFVLSHSSAEGWEIGDIWQAHSDGDLLHIVARDRATHMAGLSDNDAMGAIDPLPHLDRIGDAPNWPIIGREHLSPGQRLLWLDESAPSGRCTIALIECESHSQVLCRSRSPKRTATGEPLLLNIFTADPSPGAVSVVQAALRMAPPLPAESSVQRTHEPTDGDADTVDPSYWLPQLEKQQRGPRPGRADR